MYASSEHIVSVRWVCARLTVLHKMQIENLHNSIFYANIFICIRPFFFRLVERMQSLCWREFISSPFCSLSLSLSLFLYNKYMWAMLVLQTPDFHLCNAREGYFHIRRRRRRANMHTRFFSHWNHIHMQLCIHCEWVCSVLEENAWSVQSPPCSMYECVNGYFGIYGKLLKCCWPSWPTERRWTQVDTRFFPHFSFHLLLIKL